MAQEWTLLSELSMVVVSPKVFAVIQPRSSYNIII